MLGRFGDMSTLLLVKLFLAKCPLFYGAELWLLDNPNIQPAYTAWYVAARRIRKLHPWCHRRFVPIALGCKNVENMLARKFLKFACNCRDSGNVLIRSMFQSCFRDVRTLLGRNLRCVYLDFGNHATGHSIAKIISQLRRAPLIDPTEYQYTAIILELLDYRDGFLCIENIYRQEAQSMLDYVCIS